MIPISLSIKGLYSYQKEQHIDFTKLLEGQLFGIFGSVGSGKSSILEAISYALYGDTERLNRNDNRSYNMMNLKSNELLIDFIFINYDDVKYRFTVRGKRNSKQYDKVGTLERTAYKEVNGIWEPLDGANGESVIGLSYDNFRRTIIIPQGKFQEFLQLGDKDRTAMLKEIFQLEKYEFFYQAASLEKKNNEEIQNLSGQLAAYSTISLEEISQSKLRLTDLQLVLEKAKTELDTKRNLLNALEKVKKVYHDFKENEQLLVNLNAKKEHFITLQKQVDNYNFCLLNFKDDLNNQQRIIQENINLNQQKDNLKASLNNTTEVLETLNKKFATVKINHQNLDSYKNKLNDFEKALQLLKAKNEVAVLNERIEKGNFSVQEKFVEKENLNVAFNTLSLEIKQQKNSMPDASVLNAIKQWFLQKKHLLANVDREKLELNKLVLNEELLEEKLSILKNNEILSGFKSVELLELVENINLLKKDIEHKELLLNNKISHYQVQLKLGEFSAALHDGELCPLCGSLEHPKLLQIEDVNESLLSNNEELKRLKKDSKILDDLTVEAKALDFQYQSLKAQKNTLNVQLKAAAELLNAHEETFIWQEYKLADEFFIDEKLVEIENYKKLLIQKETDLESISTNQKKVEETYLKYKTAVDKFINDAAAKNAEVNLLKNQITVDFLEIEHFNENELLHKKHELANLITEIVNDFEKLSAEIELKQHDKISFTEKINAVTERVLNNKTLLNELELEISEKIKASNFENLEQIKNVLNEHLNVKDLETEIQQFNLSLYSVQQNYERLKLEVADKKFDEEDYLSLQNQLKIAEEVYQEKNNLKAAEEFFLKEQEKNFAIKQTLSKKKEQLEYRANNIATLKNMFKASGFVSYISSVYINNLCAIANQRFYKLSRQQLRLEVSDKNDFLIRDYLNDGKLRSVKTLSGGQTFQASLSLALALAESVQQQNKSKQNFFFLDEGFGSLDKDSLQVAFETLKSLRKENRIVGVISHIEDLQQEIDVYLQVINDATDGSMVKGNWE